MGVFSFSTWGLVLDELCYGSLLHNLTNKTVSVMLLGMQADFSGKFFMFIALFLTLTHNEKLLYTYMYIFTVDERVLILYKKVRF